MTPLDSDSRVALAEIKGDVKLILAGQDRTNADVHSIRKTLDDHHYRIGHLETDKSVRDGQRQGIAVSTKVMWAGLTLVLSGVGAAVIRLLGGM
jgi:hypothetical protein